MPSGHNQNSQEENKNMPYRQHSNNSPDDSIVDGNRPQQKQLKWILVSENTSEDPN